MRISLPIPFTHLEITPHCPGAPVQHAATPTDESHVVRRNFLPFNIQPRPAPRRPVWLSTKRGTPDQSRAEGGRFESAVLGETVPHLDRVASRSAMSDADASALRDWVGAGPADEVAARHNLAAFLQRFIEESTETALVLKRYRDLTTLPPLPSRLTELRLLRFGNLRELPDLSRCTQLCVVRMTGCCRLTQPPDLSRNVQLMVLQLRDWTALIEPPDVSACLQLRRADFQGCGSLTTAPDFSRNAELFVAIFNGCSSLQRAPDFSHNSKLHAAIFCACHALDRPPDFSANPELVDADFSDCSALHHAPDFSHNLALANVQLSNCSSLLVPPHFAHQPALVSVDLSGCRNLIRLPDFLATPQLHTLVVSRGVSQLALPALQQLRLLRRLELNDFPLPSIPEDLLQLPPECTIEIDAGLLSDAVRNRLLATLDAPSYTGPQITYFLGQRLALASRVLVEEVAAWRQEASATSAAPAVQPFDWDVMQNERNAAAFSQFLARLRETSDYLNESIDPRLQMSLKTMTAQRINQLLDRLQQSEELRSICFNLASDAIDTCGDRVALRLLDMETVCSDKHMLCDILNGVHDASAQTVIDYCRAQYRSQILADAAQAKTRTLNYVDEIEVRVGLIVAFAREFELHEKMATLLYPRSTGLTVDDLAAIRKKLCNDGLLDAEQRANTQQFLTFLKHSPLIRALLTRLYPQQMLSGHADDARQIEKGHADIQRRMADLDIGDHANAPQAQALKKAYVDMNGDIPAAATHLVLQSLVTRWHLNVSL